MIRRTIEDALLIIKSLSWTEVSILSLLIVLNWAVICAALALGG